MRMYKAILIMIYISLKNAHNMEDVESILKILKDYLNL